MKYKNKILLSAFAAVVMTPLAQAEDVKIKVGAHAFLDYESVEVAGNDLVDGTELRLFRVDVGGSVGDYVFKSNVDFAGDDVKVKDLFVDFKGDTTIRFGNFKIPNGLEQPSSLYATAFAEGNSVSKINGLGRQLGIAAYRSFGNVHLAGGVFGADVNDLSDKDIYSVSGRAAWSLEPMGEDSVLHLGVSTRYRDSGSSDTLFSYGQKPGANSAPKTVKTAGIGDSDLFVGLEAAWLYQGFSLQSEFSQTMVDCAATTCSEDPDFQAYYVDATYFIGGSRTYKDGLFKRDKVFNPVGDGGWGALAFSARYDVADLNDAVVMGGRQETVVLGATWYRDNFVRIMANYAHSEFEDTPAYGEESADAFILRAQIELY